MDHRSARALALIALREWREQRGFADSLLARLLGNSDLSERDRSFFTELFYGVLRNLTLLDHWIASLRSAGLDRDSRDLLRLGLYQLLFLGTAEHAAVHEMVALATTKRRPLINAVLRNAARQKNALLKFAGEQDLDVRESHPRFLIERWTQNFDLDQTKTLCEWNNRPPPIYARINQLKISTDAFLALYPDVTKLAGHEGFVHLPFVPAKALAEGHCYIQDPSTAAACILLEPAPGDTVLDACAAPGGKTGYLAQLMENRGLIVACDRETDRIVRLQDNLARLGVKIAHVTQLDWNRGELPPSNLSTTLFDRILIDAPCSNTGVMRRRVDLRWRIRPDDFSRMQREQVRILRATIPLLKQSGVLVYSTCSIEPEENNGVLEIIRHEFPFMEVVKQEALFPFRDAVDGAYAVRLRREK